METERGKVMKRTLLAAAIAIAIPATSISVTPALSSQSGDSLPVEVPKRDPSAWSCERLSSQLDKYEDKQYAASTDISKLEEEIEIDGVIVRSSNAKIISAERALGRAADKAEQKRIKKDIRSHRRTLRISEGHIKRGTRSLNRAERKYKNATENIKSLEAHMRRKGC